MTLTVFGVGGAFAAEPELGAASSPAAREQYQTAVNLQNREVYDLAAEEWSGLLEEHADDPLAAHARYYLGVCHYQLAHYQEAETALLALLERHDRFPLAADAWLHLGLSQLEQQAPDSSDRAAKTLATYIERYPAEDQVPLAQYFRAEALYRGGQLLEAMAVYETLIRAQPERELLADALYARGTVEQELGRSASAAATYARFLREFSRDDRVAEVHLRRGESLLEADQPAAAVPHFERASAFAGFSLAGPARLRHAETLLLLGRGDDVAAVLAEPLERFEDLRERAEALLLLARADLEAERFAAAVRACRQSLQAAPVGPHAGATRLVWAEAEQGRGQAAAAAKVLRALIASGPEDSLLETAHYRLGKVLLAAGEDQPAEAAFEALFSRWPDGELAPYALLELSRATLQRKDAAAALKAATQLLDRFPDHSLAGWASYQRGLAHYQKRQFAEAVRDLDRYLASTPAGDALAHALYTRGLAEAGLEKFAVAATTFAHVLEVHPDYASADRVLYELAWAERSAEQDDRAAATFARLANEHPASPLAQEAHFRCGEYHQKKQAHGRAAAAFRQALDADGAPATDLGCRALHQLGWAEFRAGAFARSRAAFASQLERYPEDRSTLIARVMLGECHFQSTEYAPALKGFQAARAATAAHTSDQDLVEYRALLLFHGGQSATKLEAWAESLDWYAALEQEQPESAFRDQGRYERAWAHHQVAQTEQAMKWFQRVATAGQQPLHARARFMIGELQFGQQDYRAAVKSFFKVAYGYGGHAADTDLHAWQSRALFEAARCFEMLRRSEQAEKLYEELLDRFPESEQTADARRKLARLRSGDSSRN